MRSRFAILVAAVTCGAVLAGPTMAATKKTTKATRRTVAKTTKPPATTAATTTPVTTPATAAPTVAPTAAPTTVPAGDALPGATRALAKTWDPNATLTVGLTTLPGQLDPHKPVAAEAIA